MTATGQENRKLLVTFELTGAQAAALKRLAERSGHLEAMAVLYPHTPKATRDSQAADVLAALAVVQRELERLKVASWPWIETGSA